MAQRLKPSPLPARIRPARPLADWLWQEAGPFHGLFAPEAAVDALIPHLHHPGRLLRLEDGGYCLLFSTPVVLEPLALGRLLPLRRVGTSHSSYDLARAEREAGDTRLHLVQGGRAVSLDMDRAVAADPLAFWDLSGMSVRRDSVLPQMQRPWGATRDNNPPPQRSLDFTALAEAAPPLADIQRAVDAAPDRPGMFWGRRVWRLFLSLWVTLFFMLWMIVGVLAAVSIAVNGGLVGVIIAGLLLAGLYNVGLGRRAVGPKGTAAKGKAGTGKAGTGKGPSSEQQLARQGWFDRMSGWLLWNSGMGDNLRRQIEQRSEEVRSLINRGEIDRALKHAFSLAAKQADEKAKANGYLNRLPPPRASLDLDISGRPRITASVFTESGHTDLRRQYQDLAASLSKQGDHRRAAFIHAELLDDVPGALRELEAMDAYEDAAKLATARNVAGHLTARLWFLAGQKEVALAFAKRCDALEYIANTAAASDPEFSAFVRGHWIQGLISAGDLVRAAEESAKHGNLADLHKAVLRQAVQEGLLDDPVILAAAANHLDWPRDAIAGDMAGTTAGNTAEAQVGARLHWAMTNREGGAARRALLLGLDKHALSDAQRLPLADGLARAALAYDGATEADTNLPEIKRFAQRMGLRVLAEDLRHVIRAGPDKATASATSLDLPDRVPEGPDWTMAACVAKGGTLLGSRSGELTLLDAEGARLWTDHVTELVDLVPIGPGRLVLVIQGWATERRISVLNTALHTYRRIGMLPLFGWHHRADPLGWFVLAPDGVARDALGAVGMLDMGMMLGDAPDFAFLWSIKQTTPIHLVAVVDSAKETRWLTQRLEQDGQGLLEVWTLARSAQTLRVVLLDPKRHAALYTAPQLMRTDHFFSPLEQTLRTFSQPSAHRAYGKTYTFETETGFAKENGAFLRGLTEPARVHAVADTDAIAVQAPGAVRHLSIWDSNERHCALLEGSGIALQRSSRDGKRLCLIDERGQVILANFSDRTLRLTR